MAKKPIVNYDFYRFDLPTYDTAPMVFTTTRMDRALKRLGDILATPESFHQAATDVSKCSAEWGMMDGRNFKRIWRTLQDHKSIHAEPDHSPSILTRALSFFKQLRD